MQNDNVKIKVRKQNPEFRIQNPGEQLDPRLRGNDVKKRGVHSRHIRHSRPASWCSPRGE